MASAILSLLVIVFNLGILIIYFLLKSFHYVSLSSSDFSFGFSNFLNISPENEFSGLNYVNQLRNSAFIQLF